MSTSAEFDMALAKEQWVALREFPDYAVSSLGRVRRETDGVNTFAGRILKPAIVCGYPQVGLVARGGKATAIAVHRLVCTAFHGPKPTPKHQAAHGDGVRTNNTPENLRWATCRENHADRFAHGTNPAGERNGRSVLTSDAVRIIRRAPSRRGVCVDLADRFGCSVGTINMVRQVNSPVWRGVA